MTPNGAVFRTDKKDFYQRLWRLCTMIELSTKNLMLKSKQEYENTKDPKLLKEISKYNNIQMAKKISSTLLMVRLVMSGFVTMIYLVAEAITTSGQLSIRWIEKYLNQYLNKVLGTDKKDYVLASDTDSVYITFDELVNKSFKTEG